MSQKVSIITVNLNNLEGLKKTINSVFIQTNNSYELIVIDGGSTDGSKEFIEANKHKIQYWVSEPDKGVYNAMNKGILAAKNEYLFFLNSGDLFFDDQVIENCLPHFNDNCTCISGTISFYEGEDEISTKKHPEKMTFSFANSRIISHQATFIKREAFFKYGLYNENNKIVSDSEFFFKIIALNGESYKGVNINIAKFYFGGISGDAQAGETEKELYLKRMLPYVYNNEYDTFVFNLFRKRNKKVNYIKEIEKNKFANKIATFVLKVLYRLTK